jgi:hypothetical protein
MRAYGYMSLGLLAAGLGACNPFHQAVQVNSQDVNYNTRWHGTLTSPAYLAGAVQITGSASMAPGSNGKETLVTINVTNAVPGGLHPWEVHLGQCGSDQGIFGSIDQYKPVKIGKDGRGTESAGISMPTPTYGSYFMLLHASTGNRETVIACGNMAPPAP